MLVAVLNDLIFSTKIVSTARALGVEAVAVRSAAELSRELSARPISLVIVDLNTAGNEAMCSIRMALGHECHPYVICFVSHVDEELARQASATGAHEVLPRSRFNAQLPAIVQAHGHRLDPPEVGCAG